MSTLGKVVVAGLVGFAILQAARPSIPVKPATAEVQAPAEVKRILEKSCYSCHSNQRRLSWFDEIVPGYWLVRSDILTAREHLNFSTLGSAPAAAQKATLFEAVNMIQLGAMPLPSFLKLHPEAKVTAEEMATLKDYLAPWTAVLPEQSAAAGLLPTPASPASIPQPASDVLKTVRPEFNGFPFDPEFESWKLIETTDRGDNNTIRFILGNDVAVKAAQSGQISPWPDGTRFAKIAWQKEAGTDGLVYPGKFIQVEIMLKDATRYKDTDGWGWGRWRGLSLEPYGKDEDFVNECTGCHRPVRGDDYVFTLPITAARVDRAEVVNNRAAALPASLPEQPLGWSAITMYVDPTGRSTATLFGNEVATQVKGRSAPAENTSSGPAYPAGAVLALVTWAQRDDPHWFGARIPDVPQSVEFVQIGAAGQANSFRRFSGKDLIEDHPADTVVAQRSRFIMTLAPAQLP